MRPRVLDLFAGVGGFSLGFHAAGFETVAFSEIEPFPCAVLEHRFPGVPNLGDVSKITPEQIEALGRIDVVTFGSPCQDFSVAGKRLGMKGQRSSLFHEAIRVIRHARPRLALWENVPGVFSSAGGWDFAAVLDEMAELGAVDIAWAVLDAQHFGVPQRRRRVFLVADFGGERAGEILLEPEGVRGDLEESGEAGEDVAGEARRGAQAEGDAQDAGGGVEVPGPVEAYACQGNNVGEFGTLRGGNGGLTGGVPFVPTGFHTTQDPVTVEDGSPCLGQGTSAGFGSMGVAHALTGEGFDASEDGTGRRTPLVPASLAYTVHGEHSTAMQGNGDAQVAFPTERARNLDTTGGYANGQGGTIVQQPMAFAENQRGESRLSETHPQLTTGGGKPGQGYPAVMEPAATSQSGGAGSIPSSRGENLVPAVMSSQLGASEGVSPKRRADPGGLGYPMADGQGMAVRRLTPLECERLMGWPDSWTDVLYKGKPAADGPRYRACGNGVAAPVVEWIAKRMRKEFP